MRNQVVESRVDKENIAKQIAQAEGELQELVAKYGEELVVKQFELEEYSKRLGQYLTEQDIQKRIGSSHANKYGELKRTGEADLKNFGLTQKFVDFAYQGIKVGVDELIQAVKEPAKKVRPQYYDLVDDLIEIYNDDVEKLADIITCMTLSVMLECVISGKTLIENNIAYTILHELKIEAEAENLFKTLPHDKMIKAANGLSKRVGQHFKVYFMHTVMDAQSVERSTWNLKKKEAQTLALGYALIEIATANCNYFDRVLPEYATPDNEKCMTEIHASAALVEAWKRNTENLIMRSSRFCPTLIPPKKWTSLTDGGYYGTLGFKNFFMRLGYNVNSTVRDRIRSKYLQRLNQTDISQVMAAVNAIQETPWQVNKQVLEVLKYNNEHDKGFGGLPRFEAAPKLPELPDNCSADELKEHKKKLMQYHRAETARQSKALKLKDTEYTAIEYSQYERIYFPHNLDFRGRVYPVFPGLSPQGDDLGKSLIKFADAPAITDEAALKWFYIQGANVAGQDKKPIAERLQWIKDNHEDILQSASEPTSCLWWAEQDEPWQFLAFCFEYKSLQDYKQAHNGSAIGWVTGLPFAQDGSCSGIQHYSAASCDSNGGKAVNLVPQDRPNDIYGFYADKVKKILEDDAVHGTADTEREVEDDKGKISIRIKLGTKSLAQRWLAYGITRKVCKRPVMTLPYGATAGGYKEQIIEDTIKPAIDEKRGEMFDGFQTQMAVYLAQKLYHTVSDLNAIKYMDWLREVATLITQNGNVLTWVTPLGLPIQQGYMARKPKRIWLRISGIRKTAWKLEYDGNIDKAAQKTGAPPNFIHSMDGCHLQMTVLAAYEKGIRHFAMIHDSYGAPVAQGEIMFNTVREQFIKMYTEHDIFDEFRENILSYVKNEKKIPALPPKGDLDIHEVAKSLYAFC